MPSLDWTKFDSLPGNKDQNFEDLCRALVRLRFGGKGHFAALKNQPGVEFHLKLSIPCSTLGDPPRWYGWQCKFHSRTGSNNLTAVSQQNIEDSLRKTEQHLPELTDWVLWTPYTLSKKDQEWFNGLQTNLELHLWTEKEIETYLSGPGLILRSTYFGELIATPEDLKQQHREAIQPIKDRWFQPVHQPVEAERTIRRMLGEPGYWNPLTAVGKRLEKAVDVISSNPERIESELAKTVTQFVATCSAFADTLLNFHSVLADGDIDFIQQNLRERKTLIDAQTRATIRQLRALNLSIALDATNALDDMYIAQEMLNEVEKDLGEGLVALLADSGAGKTQIAAQLTSAQEDRPAGVLLLGRHLHKGQTLNDLARNFSLNGNPMTSMENLLATIDAAGKRARCRLPVMIDGLNEAENPKDWKDSLATLRETVKRYPNILVVCTLRTGEHRRGGDRRRHQSQTDSRESFAVMALPDDIRIIPMDGFGGDANDAIERYFKHFKIDPGDAEIPVEFLQHPLTLRIFCEVMNPSRESEVKIDYFPASLSSLFEKYIENACERISQMPNLSYSYTTEKVRQAIYKLGLEMWQAGRREIGEEDFRKATSDTDRNWDSSIVNLFAQEGIIFRNPGNEPHEYVITPTYDALGGFIIASALLSKYATDKTFKWLCDRNTIQSFRGENSHELADDIFRSLVALFPDRMYGTQLWKVAPEPLRDVALRDAPILDAEHLDRDTLTAIRKLISNNPREERDLFSRLQKTRSADNHPLNANFLDSVLRPMSIAERDLSWTEWIRCPFTVVGQDLDWIERLKNVRPERFNDLLEIELQWKENLYDRNPSDQLRAKWIMWYLTSTDRELRDAATRALYWFGRGDPKILFEYTIGSLEINDPYVPERMLAASYGVAMALHTVLQETTFNTTTLLNYARDLYNSLFAEEAEFSTTHSLIREYAIRTIELAALHNPNAFTDTEIKRSNPPFADGGLRDWGESEDSRERVQGVASPFRMDFENYTIGSLVPNRHNYDYGHEGYRKVRAQILWRIEQLGWSSELFSSVDNEIAENEGLPLWMREDVGKTERYGKKYSWIAYFEMAGLKQDFGEINQNEEGERPSWQVDIDPSFPIPVPKAKVIDKDFLGNSSTETEQWIVNAAPPNVEPYLRLPEVLDEGGSWIMLDGLMNQQDEIRGRRLLLSVHSFLVANQHADSFLEHLSQRDWVPDKPSTYYTFAGEIPWCSTYPENGFSEFSYVTDEGKREDLPYGVLIPVRGFSWESYHSTANDAGYATTLAKEIALDLNLIGQPQTFDLFTQDGTRATRCVSDGRDDYHNNQSLCFIREELLRRYLKNNDCSLIWAFSGERSHSVNHTEQFYQPFYFCKLYE